MKKPPDTGEAGARRHYPDTGEPEPRSQEEPVVLEPVLPEEEIQELEQEQRPAKDKGPAGEPLWLTVWHTIFGLVVIYFLLRGLWLFIKS